MASLQCENCLKDETAKFQALYEKFTKEKATHLQAMKGNIHFEYYGEKLRSICSLILFRLIVILFIKYQLVRCLYNARTNLYHAV